MSPHRPLRDRLVSLATDPPGLYVVVALAMAVLMTTTGLATRAYNAERDARAQSHFEHAQQSVTAGQHEAAVAELREALVLDRGNARYQLALATALYDLGRLREAESYLTDLLAREATSGPANLTMARIAAALGRDADATAYYDRAAYGRWAQDTARRRIEVRFEHATHLARRGARPELLAQLLLLGEDLPADDVPGRKRVAAMLMRAGAPERAGDIYASLVTLAPDDAEVHAGLGESAFRRSDYIAARSSLARAVALDPETPGATERLDLVDLVLSLDPTTRRLTTAERFRRSRLVLELALASYEQCAESTTADPNRALVTSAVRERLADRRLRPSDEAVEANLTMAERLRTEARARCRDDSREAMALDLLFRSMRR